MSETAIRIFFSDPALNDVPGYEPIKRELEEQFGLKLDYTSIGTGAAEGAYVARLILDNLPAVLVVLFFQAKRINENLDAWIQLGNRLSAFMQRAAIFDRVGSAVLAVNELFKKVGRVASTLQLRGYTRTTQWDRQEGNDDPGDVTEIGPDQERPERIMIHVFQIEADGRLFRVFVHEKEVWLKELLPPSS